MRQQPAQPGGAGAARHHPTGGPIGDRIGRFDRWAASYDRSQLQAVLVTPVHQIVTQYARSMVPQPRRVMDIGCGTGRLLGHLAGHYTSRRADRHPGSHAGCGAECRGQAQLVGVDPSTPMLIQAAHVAAATGTALTAARAEQLPFADATFDLVVITLSLAHWHDPAAGLAEVGRIMAPGAVLVMADCLDFGDLAGTGGGPPRRRHSPRRWISPWTHRTHISGRDLPDQLRRGLADGGLRIDHLARIERAAPIAEVTLVVANRTPIGR